MRTKLLNTILDGIKISIVNQGKLFKKHKF